MFVPYPLSDCTQKNVSEMIALNDAIEQKAIIVRGIDITHQREKELPDEDKGENEITVSMSQETEDFQLSFFQLDDPVLSQIKDELLSLDINTLTPVEALMKLNEIKKLTGG